MCLNRKRLSRQSGMAHQTNRSMRYTTRQSRTMKAVLLPNTINQWTIGLLMQKHYHKSRRFEMKKWLFALALLAVASQANAAGTCTVTPASKSDFATPYGKVVFSCTADGADGSFPDTATYAAISGCVYAVEVDEGGTAPTDAYDITLVNAGGQDVMGGSLANLTTGGVHFPLVGGAYGCAPVESILTLNIDNNSVNSAVVTISLWWSQFARKK